jgi:hypothetical protein
MLCDLCHEREAVVHITTTTSAGSPGVGRRTKGDAVADLTTSTYAELLGLGSKTERHCEQCALSLSTQADQSPTAAKKRQSTWKRVEDSKVYYQLTGESVVRAVSIPEPPSSKTPAILRVTHQNSLGRVDADVFVRLGNPKAPLEWDDFDTVSDWKQASLVEDLLDDGKGGWVLRGKAKGEGAYWSGTYETEIQFPKGHHLIEIKIISRVPEVCSIVLSNWKVYVR